MSVSLPPFYARLHHPEPSPRRQRMETTCKDTEDEAGIVGKALPARVPLMQDLRNGLQGAATAVMVCMTVFAIPWASVSLLFHDVVATKELCWKPRKVQRSG